MHAILQAELDRLTAEHTRGEAALARLRQQLAILETSMAQIAGGIVTLQRVLRQGAEADVVVDTSAVEQVA
jgi:prefoldin subunit 5